ncbi:MAG: hypothetical protein K5659_09075 [Lachnospiraceae bacterium]|nr:hypothetical protein [Lachnospiraceae bacterium]
MSERFKEIELELNILQPDYGYINGMLGMCASGQAGAPAVLDKKTDNIYVPLITVTNYLALFGKFKEVDDV